MSDLRQFAIRIRRRGDAVTRNIEKIVRGAGAVALESVVNDTPVDKGTAKSNWLVGVDSSPSVIIPAHVPGTKGSTGSANAQIAIDKGTRVMAQYRRGSTIHIVNNLPYIGLLNSGWSAQSPGNFVEKASLRAKEFLRSIRGKLSED